MTSRDHPARIDGPLYGLGGESMSAVCPRCSRRSTDAWRCRCCPICGHGWGPPPEREDAADDRPGGAGGGR
jgi:hypothetical protein